MFRNSGILAALAAMYMPESLALEQEKAVPQNLGIIDEIGTTPCVFKLNSNFYDFTPIKVAYPAPQAPYIDGQIFHTKEELLNDAKYYFVFGWCQHIDESENQNLCLEDYYVGRVDGPSPTEESPCTAYSGGNASKDIKTEEITGKPKTIPIHDEGGKPFIFDTKEYTGVALKYVNGSPCETDPTRKTSFTINMYCDKDMSWDEYDISPGVLTNDGDICAPYIDTKTRAACPILSTSELWDYLVKYKYYFGALLITIGIALVFVGRSLVKPAVCLAGFFTTIFISCFIFYAVYLDKESELSEFWWFLGGGALAGILVGLFLAWQYKFGAAILAGWGGATGGLILYSAVIYRAEMDWLFWVTVVICALSAALVACIWFDEIIIITTALLGSYALVRGIACYCGHYYNEFTMANMAKEGLLDDVDKWYWAYFAGFFIMTAIGMWIQWSTLLKEKRKKKRVQHPYLIDKNEQKEYYEHHERANSMH